VRIHKTGDDSNGVRLRNEMLQDEHLSLPALGLLVRLLTQGDDFPGNADELSREARRSRGDRRGEGRRATRGLFAELERHGYLVRRRVRDAQGLFKTVLDVYDTPQPMTQAPTPGRHPVPHYPRGAYLYRHWDADGRLLYVGIAERPTARERQHETSSPWMTFQVEMTVEPFGSRADAEAAEAEAIRTEQPLFNVAGNESPAARRGLVEYLVKHGRTDLLAPAVCRG
jgi:hypothetical protein